MTNQVVLGFDGYIDNLVSLVKVRHSPSEYELMENISEFGERILRSVGSSASIEKIVKMVSVGGFTCNVGKALSTLSGRKENIHLLGAFGQPIQSIFQEQLVENYGCLIHSVGNPGLTDAYEFKDGKIMVVTFENINILDWNSILTSLGRDILINKYDISRLYGIGYWASSPHMSEIFSALQEDIFPNLSRTALRKYLLIDLSDLRKKPRSQLQELAGLLRNFEEHVKVVLLLNDQELEELGAALVGYAKSDPLALTELIQQELNISIVISHTPKVANLASESKQASIVNAYTPNPRFTTSAGDHFTAGVGYGLLVNAPIEFLPLLGNCVTSYFVRKGVSPTSEDLQQFITNYSHYLRKHVANILK